MLAAFAQALSDALTKRHFSAGSPYTLAWLLLIYTLPWLLLSLFIILFPRPDRYYFFAVAAAALYSWSEVIAFLKQEL